MTSRTRFPSLHGYYVKTNPLHPRRRRTRRHHLPHHPQPVSSPARSSSERDRAGRPRPSPAPPPGRMKTPSAEKESPTAQKETPPRRFKTPSRRFKTPPREFETPFTEKESSAPKRRLLPAGCRLLSARPGLPGAADRLVPGTKAPRLGREPPPRSSPAARERTLPPGLLLAGSWVAHRLAMR
jgi:hypothetical protein